MATSVQAGLSLTFDQSRLQAALPLLEAGIVDAIEWSFDTTDAQAQLPDWWSDLLLYYGAAGRLVGHGVFYSLFDGRWRDEQTAWLRQLSSTVERYDLRHVSEHFGWMSGADFHRGAPLGVPYTARTLALGRDRLARLADAAQRPVGLENLALAFSAEDVARQGDFLDALLESVDGFVVLDLHNLYCQAHNFGVDAAKLMGSYPLERVRELHLSGGSWEASSLQPERRIRRDTHSDRVPEEVFELLPIALGACPRVALVVLEQLGDFLVEPFQRAELEADYRRMRGCLPGAGAAGSLPSDPSTARAFVAARPLVDDEIYRAQRYLVETLETYDSVAEAHAAMRQHPSLIAASWPVDAWDLDMVATAAQLVRKWR